MNKLTECIYYVGLKDSDLKVFDIVVDTEFGTTYNSYIIKGEKTALIETAHDKLSDEFLENVREVTPIDKIDYIICNHTEPDHCGALAKILNTNPNVTVVGTIAALKNLKEITNRTFKEKLAKDGETLDLGGVLLKFIIAPNLHWPDTMMTYCESEKTLFSCDVFGAHYCFAGITDSEIENKADYKKALKVYYDCIVSPFKPFVLKGLDKLAGLDIKMICTGHGPVLVDFVEENIKKYSEWSAPAESVKKKISIFYVSAYGYTEMLAKAAFNALLNADCKAELFNLSECDSADIQAALHNSDGIMLGTPTINRNALKPVWDIVTSMDIIAAKDKQFAVFGSYGWSGEGCGLINATLKAMKLKTYDEPFRVVFKPTDTDLDKMTDYALTFAKNL